MADGLAAEVDDLREVEAVVVVLDDKVKNIYRTTENDH